MPSDLQRDEKLHAVPASRPHVSSVSAAVRDALAHQAATAPAAARGDPSLLRWSTIGSMSVSSVPLPLPSPSSHPSKEVLPGATATLGTDPQKAHPGQSETHDSPQIPLPSVPQQQPKSMHQPANQHLLMSSDVSSNTFATAGRNDDTLPENLCAAAPPPLLQPHCPEPLQRNQLQHLQQEAHKPARCSPGAEMSCREPVDGSEASHDPLLMDVSKRWSNGGSGVAGFDPS